MCTFIQVKSMIPSSNTQCCYLLLVPSSSFPYCGHPHFMVIYERIMIQKDKWTDYCKSHPLSQEKPTNQPVSSQHPQHRPKSTGFYGYLCAWGSPLCFSSLGWWGEGKCPEFMNSRDRRVSVDAIDNCRLLIYRLSTGTEQKHYLYLGQQDLQIPSA